MSFAAAMTKENRDALIAVAKRNPWTRANQLPGVLLVSKDREWRATVTVNK